MSENTPLTDVDIRLHALNLACAQQREIVFRAKEAGDEPSLADLTLKMARQYRDWIVNGDDVPEPSGKGWEWRDLTVSGDGHVTTDGEFWVRLSKVELGEAAAVFAHLHSVAADEPDALPEAS